MSEDALAMTTLNPLALLQQAITQGVNPDQLGKLMDLQDRWERNRAAERFAEALTRFQAECPQITKRREAKIETKGGGKYGYKFASLEDIMVVVSPVLARHEIVATFTTRTDVERGTLHVTCRIRVGAHIEPTELELRIPDGTMNSAQLIGTAISYAKRYAICAALNLVVTDEDPDANGLDDTLTDAEIDQLEREIEKKNFSRRRFLNYAHGKDENDQHPPEMAEIQRRDFAKLYHTLKATPARPKPKTEDHTR